MTWTLIPTPSPEELALGFTPFPSTNAASEPSDVHCDDREIRRYLVMLFVALGLVSGIHNAFAEEPAHGQRRIAEVNLSERKAECRDCPTLEAVIDDSKL